MGAVCKRTSNYDNKRFNLELVFNVNVRGIVVGGSVGSLSMMTTVAVSHTVTGSIPINVKSTKNDSPASKLLSSSNKMRTSDAKVVLNVIVPLDEM